MYVHVQYFWVRGVECSAGIPLLYYIIIRGVYRFALVRHTELTKSDTPLLYWHEEVVRDFGVVHVFFQADAATNLRDAEEVAAHYDDIRTELRRHEDLLD
eukprot:COSAG01_NODE_22080_length_872_cov_2.267788_2_plen_99_part_01